MKVYIVVQITTGHPEDTAVHDYVTDDFRRVIHYCMDYARDKGLGEIKLHLPTTNMKLDLNILKEIKHEVVSHRCTNHAHIGSSMGVSYKPKYAPELQNKLIILSRKVE